MSDSNEGWTDGADGPGRILSEDGAALNAAKSAFPSWGVEQVEEPDAAQTQSGQAAQAAPVTAALPGQSINQPPAEPPRRRGSGLLYGLLGLALLVGVAGAGYWFGTRDASDTVASGSVDSEAETTAGDADPAAPDAGDDIDTAGEGTGEDDAMADDGDGEVAGSDETVTDEGTDGENEEGPDYVAPEVDPDEEFGFESEGVDDLGRPLPVLPDVLYPNTEGAADQPYYAEEPVDAPATGPYTVIKNGFFFLRGTLPNENLRQELIQRNLAILPEEQMVVEFELEPSSEWYLGDGIPVFLLDKLLFDVGSTEVNPDFLPLFQIGANLLNIDPRISITVVGHTDSQGDDEFNLELSQARVDAVKAAYIQLGANADQVVAIAKGETEPIADNSTEQGRALNRRVEFVVSSTEFEESGDQ